MDPKTELTGEEISLVKRFRKRVEDLLPQMKNDYYRHELGLVRFLRARNLNLDKAEEMLTQHLAWRRKNDIDNILERETPVELELEFPAQVCGVDRKGNLVVLIQFGKWDLRKMVEAGLKDDFLVFITKYFELAMEVLRGLTTNEKFVSQGIILVDLEGFEFRQMMSKEVIDVILQLLRIFEANYPEILKAAWVINAPKVFQLLWVLIKPILTQRTLEKIHIHGNDKAKWKPLILEDIDEDNMASEYGGAITTCPSVHFSALHSINLFPRYDTFPEEDMTTVKIPQGQIHTVVQDLKAGQTVSWNFKTQEFDIGFRVNYEGCDDVVKYCRVDSHIHTQKGKLRCLEDGKYMFTFDNSFSAFRGKTLSYMIRVTSPTDRIIEKDQL